ncbi:MAG: CNNM domain-containing protein [bacterium]
MIGSIIGIICFLFISGFLEMVEMAVVFSDKVGLEERKARGSKRAELVLSFVDKPEWIFTTTLIGSDISIILSSFFFERVMADIMSVSIAIPLSTIIMTLIVVIFAQMLPKEFGMRYSVPIAMNSSYFVKIFSYIFFPLIYVTERISNLIIKVVIRKEPKHIHIKKEEMKILLNMKTFGGLDDRTRMIINNIFDLSEFNIKKIVRNVNISDSIDIYKTVYELLEIIINREISRLFVIDEKKRPIGIVFIKDLLLSERRDVHIGSIMKVPPVIDENTSLEDALKLMKSSQMDYLFVINNYGDVIGYIYVNDIYDILFSTIQSEGVLFNNI